MRENIKCGDVVTHPASHLDENYRWIGTVIEELGQDIIIQYKNGKTQRIGKQFVRKKMTKYTWYKAYQNTYPIPKLPDVKIIRNHFGYKTEPPYKDIEKYDLRFVDRCTTDELFDKYF